MDFKEFRERYQYDADRDLLGQGGFGRVYRARDVVLDRLVALKVFSRDVPQQYDLISEIRRAIDLHHPNICRYYGAEVLRGTNAMGEAQVIQVGIMQYVEGGTIDRFLANRPEFRKKLLIDVLRGLGYLHQHKPPIIHRDLKPSNVLVGFEDGVPVARITDFGISKAAGGSGARLSVQGLGTYDYMAPEQLNPARFGVNGKIQCNLDLWSFGAMTIELLTGVLPFGGSDPEVSTGQIMEAIIHGISPQVLNGFEEPYRSMLGKCMVQDAGKRAQTAAELLSILDAPLHVPNRQQTVVEEYFVPPKPVPPPPKPVPEPVIDKPEPIPAKPQRWVWGALAVLALVAIFAAVNLLKSTSQTNQTPASEPNAQVGQAPNTEQVTTQPSAPQETQVTPEPSAPGTDFAAIHRQAAALYDQKRYAEAAPLYGQLCDDDAKDYIGDCNRLGYMYDFGQGVTKDVSRGVTFYTKACDGGDAEGCNNLGLDYDDGDGVTKDVSRAVMLYTKSCDSGAVDGCYNLGIKYDRGEGVAKDASRAAGLYGKACDGGNVLGCNNLGIDYDNGDGVTKDVSRAATLYAKACNGGGANGCNNLGVDYHNGEGVAKDVPRAIALYTKACDGGSAAGCGDLGDSYRTGDGVDKDLDKARQLLTKSCNMGDQWGCDKLKLMQQ